MYIKLFRPQHANETGPRSSSLMPMPMAMRAAMGDFDDGDVMSLFVSVTHRFPSRTGYTLTLSLDYSVGTRHLHC